MKITKSLFLISVFIATMFSCKKNDFIEKSDAISNIIESNSTQTEIPNDLLYDKIVTAMEAQKDTSTPHHARKIDTLLANLSSDNMTVVTYKEGDEIIICDLAYYKNPLMPEYNNTYYKAYFSYENGQVKEGMNYTLHTNLTKAQVDADIENIFFQSPQNFTGMTVVNRLDDGFAQGFEFNNGVLETEYELSNADQNGQVLDNGTCYNAYLVTTSWLPDGSIEKDWEFLFQLCGACIPTGQPTNFIAADCDPDVTSSGGTVESYFEDYFWQVEINMGDYNSCSGMIRFQ